MSARGSRGRPSTFSPMMLCWISLVVLPRDRIPIEVSGYGRAVKEERVGQWFADNAAVGETIYVMCASASAYAHADAGPPNDMIKMASYGLFMGNVNLRNSNFQ